MANGIFETLEVAGLVILHLKMPSHFVGADGCGAKSCFGLAIPAASLSKPVMAVMFSFVLLSTSVLRLVRFQPSVRVGVALIAPMPAEIVIAYSSVLSGK